MNIHRELPWLRDSIQPLDLNMQHIAEKRQANLTKPSGSLGDLEKIAIKLCALQRSETPCVDRVSITIFAADHGVASEGVSAYPQTVTLEMIKNFSRGGAAINVLANELKASLDVINMGTISDTRDIPNVVNQTIDRGTKNIIHHAAMTESQLIRALSIGRRSVVRAVVNGVDLYIAGEMGIGNTTSATAIATCLTEYSVKELVGPGTGLDKEGVLHKSRIIQLALDKHKNDTNLPLDVLKTLGGFEISAMVGAYITCAQLGVTVLVDGFIATVAALVASKHSPHLSDRLLFSHVSSEPGYKKLAEQCGAEPILDLSLRLGEGSGAAVAVPILRLACALHNKMATFSEANVSNINLGAV